MANSDTQPVAGDPRKWARLAAGLRAAIESGDLEPGRPAPSITELIREGHAGARRTCAQALRALETEGLLIRYPGLGYYVAGRERPSRDG